jgi:hypothetical protein
MIKNRTTCARVHFSRRSAFSVQKAIEKMCLALKRVGVCPPPEVTTEGCKWVGGGREKRVKKVLISSFNFKKFYKTFENILPFNSCKMNKASRYVLRCR